MCQQQGRVYLGPLETNQKRIELIEHDHWSVICWEGSKRQPLSQILHSMAAIHVVPRPRREAACGHNPVQFVLLAIYNMGRRW